jgi:ABC transport system ATP-binding/permease protein
MSESILNALIHLFAIVANVNPDGITAKGRKIVESYLARYVNSDLVNEYLRLFDNYYEFYNRELRSDEDTDISENVSLISFQISNICNQIKKGLLRNERVIVFLQLLEFVHEDQTVTDQELEFVKTVAKVFNLSDSEFNNFKSFIFDGNPDLLESDKVLVIDNQIREWSDSLAWVMKRKVSSSQGHKYIYRQNLYGKFVVFYIHSIKSFIFRYFGELNLFIEGQKIKSGRPYFFNKGSIIKGPNIDSIYYNDIASKFISLPHEQRLVFSAVDLEFKFRNSKNGIHKFNFSEESGQLIGIMGGSGVGKSTLLNLLSGKLYPTKGKVKINNYNVHYHHKSLTGIIGFVPQDDLLFDELTVYQNFYYNAKLCFSDYNEHQIKEKVNSVLIDLDLYDVRNLQVGNPLKKFISGGQRKRLNIGLELMREPLILFVDEPTSGLSSMDSENVMNLLKEQTLKGRLVIANIHQPSSDIFKLFDKLWVFDKGGYPIYQGNPIDAIVYFKTITSLVNAAESECACCGTINPEQILQIVETKEIDEYGKETRVRKTQSESWYYRYIDNIEKSITPKHSEEKLPDSEFKVPDIIRQFRVFAMRNLISKLENKQYLLINLFEAPLLAFILGFFTKYLTPTGYVFAENKNLPVFLFMSVVVAIFLGLTVSAEEIIKDRKILERESFLRLSWFSYINSKIIFLFGLSALQTLLYTLIGNSILEIHGMVLPFWLILFSASCLGNIIGLNISSGLDSVIAIYVLIPLILVPQLLLGGAMIPFDDLHKSLTSRVYVPFIGNIMPTRWAYEALAVEQFKGNKFERNFFKDEQIISNNDFRISFLIPQLENKLQSVSRKRSGNIDSVAVVKDIQLIRNEFEYLVTSAGVPPFDNIHLLDYENFTEEVAEDTYGYLYFLKMTFTEEQNQANERKEETYNNLVKQMGNDEFVKFRQRYYNKKLADLVLNRNELYKVYQTETSLVQKKDPIFMEPTSRFGRSHFYSPVKIIMGVKIDTLWFNLIMMWFAIATLYLALFADLLRVILKYFQQLNLKEKLKETNPVKIV